MPGSGVSSATGVDDECPPFDEEQPAITPRVRRIKAKCANLSCLEESKLYVNRGLVVII